MAQNSYEYKEIFVPFMWDREYREYAVKDINSEARMSFCLPIIAGRLLDLKIVFIPQFDGDADFTIESEYGKNDEYYNQNYQYGEFRTSLKYDVIKELSIKSMFVNIEKGHNCGLYIISRSGQVLGLGLKIIYD